MISIQQKAGGNLSEALGNLSRVLRDRKKMRAKIKAMSMEAKASAGIIGALPLAVMLLVYLTSPDYIALLWTHPIGRMMLAGCAVWMFMGVHGDEQDDQLRLLSARHDRTASIEQAARRALPGDDVRRHRRGGDRAHLAMPLLAADTLDKRMKAVALEREKIRQRERERLARGEKVFAAAVAQAIHADIGRALQPEQVGRPGGGARKLMQAGYRGQAPYVTFLFFRMVMPVAMLLFALFYVFVVLELEPADDGQARHLPGCRPISACMCRISS